MSISKSEFVEKILPFLYRKVRDVLRAKQSLNELVKKR